MFKTESVLCVCDAETSRNLVFVVSAVCEALIAAEDTLNDLDKSGGDGDCGTTMKRGAEGKKS